MFIAHLPAGYLVSRALAGRCPQRAGLIATGLLASVVPDLDLLWFYLVDNRQTPHHSYIFHWPLFWIGLACAGLIVTRALRWRRGEPFILTALCCLLLHMVLDSVAAEIAWFAPFSSWELHLFEVPARHDWWVWNFVLHWTFALEIAIVVAAAIALWRDVTVR